MACCLGGQVACLHRPVAHWQYRRTSNKAAVASPPLPAAPAYHRCQQCCRRRRNFTAAASDSSAPAGSAEAKQLKAELLQAVSRSNNPQPGDNPVQLEERVELLAGQLASLNPTPDAALSSLLLGSWALLFSGRSRALAAAAFAGGPQAPGGALRRAVQRTSDALYSTFYAYVPVLAGSAVGAGRRSSAANVQVLRRAGKEGQLKGSPAAESRGQLLRVDNIVETKGPARLRLCVSGSVEPVCPTRAGAGTSCVAVTFDQFTAAALGLPAVQLSLKWLSPLGYVDTIYLDQDLRVSLGDKGGLFVLRRIADTGPGPAAAAGRAQR